MTAEAVTLALVVFGVCGMVVIAALVLVIWHRQKRLLARIEEAILEVEQETRATSHAVGADGDDVEAAGAGWRR